MTLEILPRRFPRPHFRPVPRPRWRGYPTVYQQEPIVLEVEREPALPWRVVSITSWGTTVLSQSLREADATRFFKQHRWPSPPPFNNQLDLQHWTGAGWQKVAGKNSSDRR